MSVVNKKETKKTGSKFGFVELALGTYNYLFRNTKTSSGVINWGDNNMLPEYLFEQYITNPYLGSIINKTVDFIIGGGIKLNPKTESFIQSNMAQTIKFGVQFKDEFDKERRVNAVNTECDTLIDIIKPVVRDWLIFGTPAIDLFFSNSYKLSEIYYMDVIKNRLIADRDSVRHSSEGWQNGYMFGTKKYDIPLFKGEENNVGNRVFMLFDKRDRTIYPLPYYFSALGSINVGTKIIEYNETSIDEGFSPFIAMSFPNSTSDNEMEKIAKYNRKDNTGSRGSKILYARKDSDGQSIDIASVPQENIGERFNALATFTEQQIYAGLDAPKQLYGNQIDSGVFNDQQYYQVLSLHFESSINPMRDEVISWFDYIFGIKESFSFKPSRLESKILDIDTNTNNIV